MNSFVSLSVIGFTLIITLCAIAISSAQVFDDEDGAVGDKRGFFLGQTHKRADSDDDKRSWWPAKRFGPNWWPMGGYASDDKRGFFLGQTHKRASPDDKRYLVRNFMQPNNGKRGFFTREISNSPHGREFVDLPGKRGFFLEHVH